MKSNWLWLLAGALTACGGRGQLVADGVALHHQHDAAVAREARLLQAGELKLTAGQAGAAPTLLSLALTVPRDQPTRPDSLHQRVRRLAQLVAADLAEPGKYQVISVQVTGRTGYFDREATSQAFLYPLTSLRQP
ncbi:hypothetical protein HHL22_17645 [Hymenobacter sp. RP-2-7]|uniref:Lipoprotein n=1 Tax=Hymenobacter polaris TaxID=2682546 RepID=A0A7Y0FP49_9BACT|nr:hypothetical protein [Hymenobacter polaris]NML67034.1 hypothetical protein [Hymenobacter polaris]